MAGEISKGVLALDIGSGKIAGVVGTLDLEGIHILSVGANNHPTGFKNGRIINFEQALTDIKQTIARICYFSNVSIQYLVLNVKLKDIPYDFCGQGLLTPEEIDLEHQDKIKPFLQLAERLNVKLLGMLPDALAMSKILLKNEDKKQKALLLDSGRSYVKGAFFQNGVCQRLFEVPIGGRHITNDIAFGLNKEAREAEGIKIRYSMEQDVIDLSEDNKFLAEIIQARLKEVFILIKKQLEPYKLDHNDLVVLTGGMSRTRGFIEEARSVLGGQYIFRHHPVPECKLTVGAEWEAGPVGLLAYALSDQRIRNVLLAQAPAIVESRIIAAAEQQVFEPLPVMDDELPVSSLAWQTELEDKLDLNPMSEPDIITKRSGFITQVISPVRIQPKNESLWERSKALFEEVF
ncbi:MAG: cell division FtsA domain-containing protein [Candidatus Margulisiibacteriota bacterium]|jgi:cell division ATPase FtsA